MSCFFLKIQEQRQCLQLVSSKPLTLLLEVLKPVLNLSCFSIKITNEDGDLQLVSNKPSTILRTVLKPIHNLSCFFTNFQNDEGGDNHSLKSDKSGKGSQKLKFTLDLEAPGEKGITGQYFQTSTAVNYESRFIFYGSGIFI